MCLQSVFKDTISYVSVHDNSRASMFLPLSILSVNLGQRGLKARFLLITSDSQIAE